MMDHQRKTDYQPKSAWGRWVLEVLQKHDSGFRQQRQRTGVPHSSVVNWVQDIPPEAGGVIAFARGFGEDVNEALEIAGYETIESGADVLYDGWVKLCEEHPELVIPFPRPGKGARDITTEKARSALNDIRNRIERGGYPKKEGEG